MLRVLLAAAFVLPLAASTAGAADTAPEMSKAPEYRIVVTAPTVKVGEKGVAEVAIKALGDYKWNKDYPAKASVKAPAAVKADKTEFSQLKGDFKTEETVATVQIPFTASKGGTQTLTVDSKFSICSEKVCLLKKATTDVAVIVSE